MSDFMHHIEPPASLENRVVASLRARGLIAPPRRRRVRPIALATAAAVAIFAVGYLAGAWQARRAAVPAPVSPRFLLLLHDTAAMAASAIPEPQLVEEYRTWARNIRAEGHGIQGEKLKDETGQTLSGFFIVEAASLEAARAIAASCPHVRHGGRIQVREIDPT